MIEPNREAYNRNDHPWRLMACPMICTREASVPNQWTFKHAARKVPLNDSTYALSLLVDIRGEAPRSERLAAL
jgi:hypothetical protein